MRVNIDFVRAKVMANLRTVQQYVVVMDQQLGLLSEVHESLIKAEFGNSDEFSSQKYEFEAVYGGVFPRSLRYSFVMLLYSVVENEIVAVCAEIRKRRHLFEESIPGKETPLERCKKFLSKNCDIDFGVMPEWQKLTVLEKVRDCIAHVGGRIDFSRDRAFLESVSTSGMGITKSNHPIFRGILTVEQAFCLECSAAVISFFTIIFDQAGFGSETMKRP